MFLVDLKEELEFLPDKKIKEIEDVRQKLLDTGLPCILFLLNSLNTGTRRAKRYVRLICEIIDKACLRKIDQLKAEE